MKLVLSFVAVGLAASSGLAAAAPQYGTVLSSTPVTAQVDVPRQRCVDETGYVQAPTTGGGAVVGGIVGGLAGNAIGAGAGRALATGVGAIAGALVGNGVEAANAPPVPVTTTNCTYSRSTQSRIVGYDVVYEFNGQRYDTRTARDPGDRIALDVRPAGEAAYDVPPIASSPRGPAYAVGPAYPVGDSVPPAYDYPPFGVGPGFGPGYYGPGYYAPTVPVYIEGRFGGGRGHRH